jgi:hypothetical protein
MQKHGVTGIQYKSLVLDLVKLKETYAGKCSESFYVIKKARGLVQHGGPPGWLEESDPVGVSDFVRDGRAVPPAFSVPYRLP